MSACSGLLFIAVIKLTKTSWGGKGDFWLTNYSPSSREVKATTWREERCLPACSPWLSPNLLSHTSQDHLPGVGPSIPISCQENAHLDMLIGQAVGGTSSVEIPSLQVDNQEHPSQGAHLCALHSGRSTCVWNSF